MGGRRRRGDGAGGGFTLVELLVVLAIVAVLAAMLLPALFGTLGAAENVRCCNRLRTIGGAYHEYIADAGGVWPPMISPERPEAMLRRIRTATGLVPAPARPAADWGQPGPHWSVVLWPYINALEVYTCPSDPKRGLRGTAVTGAQRVHGAAFLDAPPESYALNVVLFRTADDLRRQAGCTWGVAGDAPDFNGLQSCTTEAEQRRQFPGWPRAILFFCGASGQTFGSQFNVPFRTGGMVERWEWHPRPASAAFADEPGIGSNYLFADGRVESRDALPSLAEWGYDLGTTPTTMNDE
jgi:prepilin-type N-terminal cleavage/methylation domain-containing protein/prepilin-type processing-associated H-X9-DG protein